MILHLETSEICPCFVWDFETMLQHALFIYSLLLLIYGYPDTAKTVQLWISCLQQLLLAEY